MMTLLEDLKEEEAEQEAGNASDGAYAADLLRRAIAEVKRLQAKYDNVQRFMEGIRNTARDRNPKGVTILDFMAVWNEQYEDRCSRLQAEVERLQAVVGGKFESLGFLPTTILGRLEMKLPSGKWLVLQDCSRLGLALESHSSHVDWARAAEAAEKHKHVCGLQGFDPNRDECDGCREAAEAYRKAKGR